MNKVPREILDLRPEQTAYCQHCKAVTSLRVTIIPQIVAGTEGHAETVVLRTYHCESCRLFVRSEEV